MKPFPENANYRAEIRAILALHRLWLEGKGESAEADALRDATDGPWALLSESERKRIHGLSQDLNAALEATSNQAIGEMTAQADAKLIAAIDAWQRGDWDLALETLRELCKSLAPALLASLRGEIWREAGDPETAAVFFQHASRLEPAFARA